MEYVEVTKNRKYRIRVPLFNNALKKDDFSLTLGPNLKRLAMRASRKVITRKMNKACRKFIN